MPKNKKEVSVWMEIAFGFRLKHAWNAFFNRDPYGGYR